MTSSETVALVKRLHDLRDIIKGLKSEEEQVAAALKAALESDPEPIVDGEHGLVARLQERNKPAEVDLISFSKRPDGERLLREAAEQGLLSARVTQLKGLAGRSEAADALLSVSAPGGVTSILVVEKVQ